MAASFVVAGLWWTAPSADVAVGAPPNVVVVIWDTVRADRLSTYGYASPTTPFLDAFAAQAVVYDDAIAPSFWTVPSHASLFTGLPVVLHGAHAGDPWLDNRFYTLAEWFSDNGYDTYAFSANPNIGRSTNLDQGFSLVETPDKPPWRHAAERWSTSKLIATDRSHPRAPGWVHPEGVDRSDLKPFFKDVGPVAADAVGAWLALREDPQRPFFAFVNVMEAHGPRLPSRESRLRFASEQQLELGLATAANVTAFGKANQGEIFYTADEIEAMNLIYDAAIYEVDRATEALIERLRVLGALDNTIVIITSDHGENIGDYGLFGHNFVLHDSLVRVPLVIWWPKRLDPERVAHPVSLTGLFGALVELTGLPAPTTRFAMTSLRDQAAAGPVVSELLHPHGVPTKLVDVPSAEDGDVRFRQRFRAIYRGPLKMIRSLTTGVDAVYDRSVDPGELEDISAVNPEATRALSEDLARWEVAQRGVRRGVRRRDERRVEDGLEEQLRVLGYVE